MAPTGWQNPTRLENAYEFLTVPATGISDRGTHTLYYIPRPGEIMATATVEVPVVEQLFAINGDSLTR